MHFSLLKASINKAEFVYSSKWLQFVIQESVIDVKIGLHLWNAHAKYFKNEVRFYGHPERMKVINHMLHRHSLQQVANGLSVRERQ